VDKINVWNKSSKERTEDYTWCSLFHRHNGLEFRFFKELFFYEHFISIPSLTWSTVQQMSWGKRKAYVIAIPPPFKPRFLSQYVSRRKILQTESLRKCTAFGITIVCLFCFLLSALSLRYKDWEKTRALSLK